MDRTFAHIQKHYYRLPLFLQQHSQMVGCYAQVLTDYLLQADGARQFGNIPLFVLSKMQMAGKYHDIGKAVITEKLWCSDQPLTDAGRNLVKAHPLLGAQLIREVVFLPEQENEPGTIWDAIAQCCQYHHERWDGQGYPFGLAGEAIPILARVVAIADAYDAMTANRPYHQGISPDAALAEIRQNAGKQFDPFLADIFIHGIKQREPAAASS
jgi:HD-GYP domain-containing protein (c-di-GMP phosphodiesterase class II)